MCLFSLLFLKWGFKGNKRNEKTEVMCMKKHPVRRLLSLALALIMILGILPTNLGLSTEAATPEEVTRAQSLLTEKFVTDRIAPSSRVLIVLGPIHFDHKFSACDIEIHDKAAQCLLSMNRRRQRLQKIIPQMPLFLCHFPSQAF